MHGDVVWFKNKANIRRSGFLEVYFVYSVSLIYSDVRLKNCYWDIRIGQQFLSRIRLVNLGWCQVSISKLDVSSWDIFLFVRFRQIKITSHITFNEIMTEIDRNWPKLAKVIISIGDFNWLQPFFLFSVQFSNNCHKIEQKRCAW